MNYLHDSVAECKAAGDHLKSCDDDGFCNACGHQFDPDDPQENGEGEESGK